MLGSIIYFAATGTSAIHKGRVVKRLPSRDNKEKFIVHNLDELGSIVLTRDEMFSTQEEAREYIRVKIRNQYISIAESFTAKELLEYLISLHPLRNEVDYEVRKVLEKSIEKYFNIIIDDIE
jgi:hypothetical protein